MILNTHFICYNLNLLKLQDQYKVKFEFYSFIYKRDFFLCPTKTCKIYDVAVILKSLEITDLGLVNT